MSSIDVVVPCYRYARFLRECVQSVLTQNQPNIRILIIDDASPDHTPEVATKLMRADSRVNYVRHAVNIGHIATYNEGIAWAAADYMLLLSADDYLLPGALSRAIAQMDAHPDAGLCFGAALALGDDGSLSRMEMGIVTDGQSVSFMSSVEFVRHCARARSNNVVPTPTAVVRTDLIKRLGGYRPDLPHSGDMEMWLRLATHSISVFLNTQQAVYRRHGDNMSRGYFHDDSLTDLLHRKAAIDAFREECRAFPETQDLYGLLLAGLARDALGKASIAFNNNQMDSSRQLREFSIALYPRIKLHPAWFILWCKRLIGFRVITAIRPAVARILSFVPWLLCRTKSPSSWSSVSRSNL